MTDAPTTQYNALVDDLVAAYIMNLGGTKVLSSILQRATERQGSSLVVEVPGKDPEVPTIIVQVGEEACVYSSSIPVRVIFIRGDEDRAHFDHLCPSDYLSQHTILSFGLEENRTETKDCLAELGIA